MGSLLSHNKIGILSTFYKTLKGHSLKYVRFIKAYNNPAVVAEWSKAPSQIQVERMP